MAEHRQREMWGRWSVLLAVLVNVNRDPKKRPVSAEDFNPYAEKRRSTGTPITAENVSILKSWVTHGRNSQ